MSYIALCCIRTVVYRSMRRQKTPTNRSAGSSAAACSSALPAISITADVASLDSRKAVVACFFSTIRGCTAASII